MSAFGTKKTIHSVKTKTTSQLNRVIGQKQMIRMTECRMAGIINLFVDDLFGTGGTEMEQRVLARLRSDFQVGSEDWNDVTFTGQRIRRKKEFQTGSYIAVSQQKAIDELKEILVERNTKEDLHCTVSMHTMYRSLLVQINWLQSRTQFQCCHKFSRCAFKGSMSNVW